MNKKAILAVGIILILVLGLGIFIVLSNNRDIAPNPEDTIGNTAGNLNNGGTFCEANDVIYFSNPYDENTLYKMKSDLTDIKKVSGASVGFLNVAGEYLYYYQKNSSAASSLGFVVHVSGLYRSDLNGNHVLCLDKSDCDMVSLLGNQVYYTKAVDGQMTLCLHRISTSKKNPAMLTDYLVNPASIYGTQILFNGTVADHYLYAYDTRTDTVSLISQNDMWFPVYDGGYVYFLDLSGNYRLSRLSLADGTVTVLADERVECFNVANGYVYYQTNDPETAGLYRVRIDGSDKALVSSGIYHNINIAGGYVFFQSFQTEIPQFMCPVGSTSVSSFDAAKTAAIQNMK